MPEVQDINVKEIPAKIAEAIAEDKWPLFLDSSVNIPVQTFFKYKGGTLGVEAKKGMVEACIQKSKSVEEVQEEWREALQKCMVQRNELGSLPGMTFWVNLGNSAVDFNGKFATEGSALPPDFFDCARMKDEACKEKYLKGPMDGVWGEEFNIVFTSHFEKEDVHEFLGSQMPLDKLKVFNVVQDGKPWVLHLSEAPDPCPQAKCRMCPGHRREFRSRF